MTIEGQAIVEEIRRKYGSLDSPDFSFVQSTVDQQPYADLIRDMAAIFEVADDTDVNDDVSFAYHLRKDGSQWALRLSMVGPYAVLLRVGGDGAVEVVTDGTVPAEASILRMLAARRLRVLDRDALEQSVPITLYNAEPENTRVFQALFSDTDVLPWASAQR